MQSPVSQSISQNIAYLKFSNFCLQTPLGAPSGILVNAIRPLSTIAYGDPELLIPSGIPQYTNCKVKVRLMPSLLMLSTAYVVPLNTTCEINAFGKVSPASPTGISINGQQTSITTNTKEDEFILNYMPSIINFSEVYAYFSNSVYYNAGSYTNTPGLDHRYQVIVDVSITATV